MNPDAAHSRKQAWPRATNHRRELKASRMLTFVPSADVFLCLRRNVHVVGFTLMRNGQFAFSTVGRHTSGWTPDSPQQDQASLCLHHHRDTDHVTGLVVTPQGGPQTTDQPITQHKNFWCHVFRRCGSLSCGTLALCGLSLRASSVNQSQCSAEATQV